MLATCKKHDNERQTLTQELHAYAFVQQSFTPGFLAGVDARSSCVPAVGALICRQVTTRTETTNQR